MNALTPGGVIFGTDAGFTAAQRRGLTHPDGLRRIANAAGVSTIGLTYARDQIRWLLRPTRGKSLSWLALAYRSDHRHLKRLTRSGIRMVGADLRRATERQAEAPFSVAAE